MTGPDVRIIKGWFYIDDEIKDLREKASRPLPKATLKVKIISATNALKNCITRKNII